MIARKLPLANASKGLVKSPLMNSAKLPFPAPAARFAVIAATFSTACSTPPFMLGFNPNASAQPKIAAKTDVQKYHSSTPVPNFPNFFSGRFAAPITSEKKMMGNTIIFSMDTSTVPKGESTFTVVPTQDASLQRESTTPSTMPSTKAAPTR